MSVNPTDLAAWRKARGRVGVQELPEAMPEGTPFTLVVDYSGLTELAINGQVPNPLIDAALRGLQAAQEDAATISAQPEGTQGQALLAVKLKLDEATARWQDAILGAFIVSPPYIRLDDLPRGGAPEGAICLHDIPDGGRVDESDVRTALVALALGGYASLETFRRATQRPTPSADGGEVRAGAEQLVSPPEPPASVLPRPSALPSVVPDGKPAPAAARARAAHALPRANHAAG